MVIAESARRMIFEDDILFPRWAKTGETDWHINQEVQSWQVTNYSSVEINKYEVVKYVHKSEHIRKKQV